MNVEEKPFTVLAFWHETWERFAWQVWAPDPDFAEQLTHQEAHSRGGTIGVCGVIQGHHAVVDVHQFVDPSCLTIEQMNAVRRQAGY